MVLGGIPLKYDKLAVKYDPNRLERDLKSILYLLRIRQLEGQSTTIDDVISSLDLKKEVVTDVLNELQAKDIIVRKGPNSEFKTIELTEIGAWVIDTILNAPYSFKQILKAIFLVRRCEDTVLPLLYQDFKKRMFENARNQDSRFANVLTELKKNDLVEIYRVTYKGLKNPRKAVRLTKLGRLITTKLLYDVLTPNEINLLRLYRGVPQEKKQEAITYLLQQNTKK